jgi:hypothetical protein
MYKISIGLFIFGVIVSIVNVYIHYVRYIFNKYIFKREHKFISGFALIGQVPLIIALITLLVVYGDRSYILPGIFFIIIDPGGIHFFLWSLWKNRSLK